MNNLKHKERNRKRTTTTTLISTEFCALNENGQLRATFKTETELKEFNNKSTERLTLYKFITYKINNSKQTIKIKEK